MAAMRHSGRIVANIEYYDGLCNNGQYCCILWNADSHKHERVWIGATMCLTVAVDSPAAFDSAFRAALAFADSDLSECCEYSKNGDVLIRRRKKTA